MLKKQDKGMERLNRLILHPDFDRTIQELSNRNVFLPDYGDVDAPHVLNFTTTGQLIANIEEIKPNKLNAKNGCDKVSEYLFSAYDESIMKFMALEGTAYFTTHSLVVAGTYEYIPILYAVFNFYTRAEYIVAKSAYIKHALDPEIESKRDYMNDRLNFLLKYSPIKSVLFIDGPLIGGNLYTIAVDNNSRFLDREVIPIYIVKNSSSDIVTQNIESLKGKYNSDMHWLQTFLKPGERSCFFKYEDQVNKKNCKVFCYLKAFNTSPQRIEMHIDTYKQYGKSIETILDIIYYLFLVQGAISNSQIRPIAIAEAYARTAIKLINIKKYFEKLNITPTMNQVRFGG